MGLITGTTSFATAAPPILKIPASFASLTWMPPAVPVTGKAGTAVLFHCNVLHASGHNLSAEDRWHIYVSCNAVANKPAFGSDSRPDYVVSRNCAPLPIEDDAALAAAA